MSTFTDQVIVQIQSSNAGLNAVQFNTVKRALNELNENHEFSKLLDACIRTKVSILNHFKLDERFVIVETNDTFAKYHTIDLDNKCTIGQCANEFDIQMLITLAYKHDGLNSQFPYYAARMLNIELK